ncbi:MAG: hypothetical protein PT936_03305, partial [Treponema sp.]|nr:hypothetical protein [Treponema sp.]
AADPAFAPSLAEYSGNQSVTWGIDLDSNKTGFKNDGSATLKFNLFTAGDKTTSGDSDIWAELKIKNDAKDTTGAMVLPGASVDTAKFHIYNMYVGIKSGDTLVGGCKPQTAIKSSNVGIEAVGSKVYTQGIVAGYDDSNFGVAVDFRSKPILKADNSIKNQYTNDYALAAEAEFKASNEFVTGLEVKAGIAYQFADNAEVEYAASAAYKVDLGDYYLKPTVGYTSANEMVGAVLFGWGDEADADAGVYYLKDLKKVTPGVSVLYKKDLDVDTDLGLYEIAFNLGSKVENLKAAALAEMGMTKVADETITTLNVKAGCAYDIKADDITITTKAGCDWTKNGALAVSAGVDFAGVINNTTLSAEYVSGDLLAEPDAKKGKVNFTAKIAL